MWQHRRSSHPSFPPSIPASALQFNVPVESTAVLIDTMSEFEYSGHLDGATEPVYGDVIYFGHLPVNIDHYSDSTGYHDFAPPTASDVYLQPPSAGQNNEGMGTAMQAMSVSTLHTASSLVPTYTQDIPTGQLGHISIVPPSAPKVDSVAEADALTSENTPSLRGDVYKNCLPTSDGRLICRGMKKDGSVCNARLKNLQTFKVHFDGVHLKRLRRVCDECHKGFSRSDSLKRHQIRAKHRVANSGLTSQAPRF